MGKRFSESAAKKAAGLARKRDQAHAKQRAQMEQLEAEEASKWEQGSRKENAKKLEEEQKRQEKARAKKERDAFLAAEEEQLGKGGKGKRKMK
ncbi:AGA_1a_G0021530.mRNA.1.CDS.1 [Saccharomyces cerevisiae]|nr:BBL_G0021460.mRNA.1.CDS.1 [Saccharomyces cerevisiae]CAI4503974.1 AGA_1a_G0021530.mRNA.1.CDS.1 [Saccharomyces cerevisiae]CAI6685453.1 AGA_1a_G0021530.mRNA.1.CDS.1 [Saccharomyces cerevisiae]CAI7131487.1 BBL_G0021460.mRNA.1.CDS.1 [Saccharomyces cerevisiae]